jgi:Zn-dependent protease
MEGSRGALAIGRVGGIDVSVHASLLVGVLFFAYVAGRRMSFAVMAAMASGDGALAGPGFWTLVLAGALVASVALHEGAHLVAARAVGMNVGGISLQVLGGSTVAAAPSTPGREALVALAGPMVTLAAALVLLLVNAWAPPSHLDARLALVTVAELQVALGAIDLVPAPPLDGGRILAAVLAGRIGRARARRVVASVGQGMAAAVAVYGTVTAGLPWIGLAAILWGGAEGQAIASAGAYGQVRVRAATVAAPWVDQTVSLAQVVERMRAERVVALVVASHGRVAGIVAAADVARVPGGEREGTMVAELCRPAPAVGLERTGEEALGLMRRARVRALPVVHDGVLVGLVTERGLEIAVELAKME